MDGKVLNAIIEADGSDVWVLIHHDMASGFMLAVYPFVQSEGLLIFGDGDRERAVEVEVESTSPGFASVELVDWFSGPAELRPLDLATGKRLGFVEALELDGPEAENLFIMHLVSDRAPDWRPQGWAS